MFGKKGGSSQTDGQDPDSPTTSPGGTPTEPMPREGSPQESSDTGVWKNHGEEGTDDTVEKISAEEAAVVDNDNSSGMTDEEASKVAEMEKILGLAEKSTYMRRRMCVRFLRARRGDVPAAAEMLKNALAWREENNVDQVLKIPDPKEKVFQAICPHSFHGFDKQGHPVYYERTGIIVMGELMKHCSEDEIVFRHVRQMEYLARLALKSSKKNGRPIEKFVLVCDLQGLPYGPNMAGQRCFRRTTRIDQDYYPERLHKVFFINAPISFRGIWQVVKPWLNPVTQAKIEIIGARYHDRLTQLIDNDQIPKMYGGQCECKHENGDGCLSIVRKYPDDPNIPPPWSEVEIEGDEESL